MATIDSVIEETKNWRSSRTIDASVALTEAQLIELAQFLQAKVAELSIAPEGKLPDATAIAFSGKIGDTWASDLAEQRAAASNGAKYTIKDTEAGRLLNTDAFKDAVFRAAGTTELGIQLLSGKINGVRVSQYGISNILSIDDQVSLRFAQSARGSVEIIADKFNSNSVLALTEFPAFVSNADVPSVSGITRETYQALLQTLPSHQVAEVLHTLALAGESIRGGKLSVAVDGVTKTQLEFVMEKAGPESVRENLRKAKVSLSHPAVRALGPLGVVADLISMYAAANEASEHAKAGRHSEAATVVMEWSARFSGSMAGGIAAAEIVGTALAPLAATGPLGAAGWGILTLMAGIAGGILGDQVIAELFEPFGSDPTWNLTTTVQIASKNDAEGLAYRYALAELNPIALLMGVPPNPAALALYDPATGAGLITRGWIEARCIMMAAFVEYYGRDEENDRLLSKSFALPFNYSGDVVMSDASFGADGNLTIDGFDFGFTQPRYLRFGDQSVNTLTGGDRDDRLFGEGGDDTLTGGDDGNSAEKDYLEGGLGNDTYIYRRGDGQDIILDIGGSDHLQIAGEVVSGTFVRTVDPRYPIRNAWTLEDAEEGELYLTLLSGSLEDGTLEITGSRLGDGGSITIEHFSSGQFGFDLGAMERIREIRGNGQFSEGNGSAFVIPLSSLGAPGQVVRFAVGPAFRDFVRLSYAGTNYDFNGDGTLQITLEGGERSLSVVLFSSRNVQQNTLFNLSAVLLDLAGDPISGSGAFVPITIEAIGQPTENPLPATYTVDGDQDPLRDSQGEIVYDQWHNIVPIGADPGRDDNLFGTPANDLMSGGEGTNYYFTEQHGGQDRIVGGSWMDIAIMGSGDDVAIGGNGRDRLAGNGGSDRIYAVSEVTEDYAKERGVVDTNGSGFEDFLTGGAGNDLLVGSESRDVLSGGAGKDTLIAGAGDDFVLGDRDYFPAWQPDNYDPDPWSVTVAIAISPGPNGTLLETYTYTVVNAIRYDRPDPDGDDVIYAGGGNDVVLAGGGNDLVYGETGNDVIFGSLGDDVIVGGVGDDVLIGGDLGDSAKDDDALYGGDGNDKLSGYGGKDQLLGGNGDDVLVGDAGDAFDGEDILDGGTGNDTLIGGGKADALKGGAGNDHIYGDDDEANQQEAAGNDLIEGGDGDDVVAGYGGADNIDGGEGNDLLNGDGNADADEFGGGDVIAGGNGNDIVVGGGGADTIHGGAGQDELFGDASYTPGEFMGDDVIDGGDGDDTITGHGGGDTLLGGAGHDIMMGDGSNVTPVSVQGDDVMDGGDGNDLMVGDGGNDQLYGGAGDDQLSGGEGNDLLVGGDGADQIQGDAGNDVLVGGSEDFLFGGAGDDTYVITSLDGRFNIFDNQGSNTIIVSGGTQPEGARLRMSGGNVLLVYDETNFSVLSADTFASFDNFDFGSGQSLTSVQMHSRFTPGQSLDRLIRLNGGVGPGDLSFRARGNDLIILSSALNTNWFDAAALTANNVLFRTADRTEYGGAPGGSAALVLSNWYLSNSQTYVNSLLAENGASLNLLDYAPYLQREFSGDDSDNELEFASGWFRVSALGGNDTVRTSNGFDFLDGGAGDDSLDSGAGDDVLVGGDGNDTLRGGDGDDQYRYAAGDGADFISDSSGLDTLVLSGIAPQELTITESVLGLQLQIGPSNFGNSISIASTSPYIPSIDMISFDGGIVWNAQQIDGHISGNRVPRVLNPLADATAQVQEVFSRTIPANAFFDPNAGDVLTYTATLADGNALPTWLAFDAATRTLSGTPDFGDAANLAIVIIATDPGGLAASDTFSLVVPTLIVLTGTSGVDSLHATNNNAHVLRGLAGNDGLIGLGGNDRFEGGTGNDGIDGGAGGDTFVWNLGDGRDQIYNGSDSAPGQVDTLLLGPGIAPTDVRIAQSPLSAGDMWVYVRDNATGLETRAFAINWIFSSWGPGVLDRILFNDGTIWNGTEMLRRSLLGGQYDETLIGDGSANLLAGSGGNDHLRGDSGNDDYRGGAGDDQMTAGAGDDTYRFARNDGVDEINDLGGTNRIVFDAGILPGEVSLYRDSSNSNLFPGGFNSDALLVVLNGGLQQVRVESYYSSQSPPVISEIVFGDGTIWNTAAIASRVINVTGVAATINGTAGNDAFNVDHSNDFINESSNAGTDSVTSTVSFNLPSNVENLTLSGRHALYGGGNSLDNTITGNAFANILDGRGGTDTLIGGAGDDRYLVSTPVHFGWGNALDTIIENAGEGYDTIVANSIYSATLPTNVEALIATGGTNPSFGDPTIDQRRKLVGNALANVIDAFLALDAGAQSELVLDGGGGADILIGSFADISVRFVIDDLGDQFVINNNTGAIVETPFSFTTREGIARVDLVGTAAVSATGGDANETFYGSTNSAANVLTGGRGNDSYVVGAGDFVVENAGEGIDSIRVMEGPLHGTVQLSSFANIENLHAGNALGNVTLVGTAGDNVLRGNSGANTLMGGAGNDTIYDSSGLSIDPDVGTDLLLGGSGNDRLISYATADTLDGGAGDDLLTGFGSKFVFGYGSEFDTIDQTNAGGWIQANAGITAGDIRVGRENTTMHIYLGSADRISVTQVFQASLSDWTVSARIQGLQINGGPLMTTQQLGTLAQTATGVPTGLSDTVTGTSGADRLELLGGDDSVSAGAGADILVGGTGNDTLRGNGGGDVYRCSAGFGQDIIQDSATGSSQDSAIDVIEFDASIIRASVSTSRPTSTDDLLITVGMGGDQITVRNFYAGGPSSDQIELLRFADGSTITATELLNLPVIEGTAGADTLNATSTSTILRGLGGNDSLNGNDGNDVLDGGLGEDQMAGGAGNDRYIVDHANDQVVEGLNSGDDSVETALSYSLGANLENLTLTGVAANNLTGNGLANILNGNAAANVLNGGASADSMTGGAGDDTYFVDDAGDQAIEQDGGGIDHVHSSVSFSLGGHVENLTLTGTGNINGAGNDADNVITGNSGNNTLAAGGGLDQLSGGAGDDIYVIDAGDSIVEAPGGGTDTVVSSASFTLTADLENLTLSGTDNINANGNSGNNVLLGNLGANILDGGAGADDMRGGAGNDTYRVDSASDTVTELSGEGSDMVESSISYTLGTNVDSVRLLGSGDLNATGNNVGNLLYGNSGNNELNAGLGGDYMEGGAGNDIYYIDDLDDAFLDSSGIDEIRSSITFSILNFASIENLALTGSSAITATGNTGNNVLTGNDGQNTLTGGSGNDTLDGGAAGNDILNGGQGDDTFIVNRSGLVLQEVSGQGNDTVRSSITFTLANHFENLTLTGTANVDGNGNSVNNTITGNSGNNALVGNGGLDQMIGGLGNDTYTVVSTNDIVTEQLSEGIDSVTASVTGYTLANNVENMTLSGSIAAGTGNTLDNVISGNAAVNTLNGGDGHDTLNGLGGNDTLNGGNGNDILDGGIGADSMSGGAGDDTYHINQTGETVTESSNAGTDTIVTTFQLTGSLANNVENLTLGASIVTGTGNTLNNVITGNAANNTLSGGDGNDTLNGMAGNDSMTGGAGNDIFVVDSLSDVVTEASGGGTDTVQTSVQITTWAANVENMTLLGSGNLTITGTTGANVLVGNSGSNSLNGGSGDDTINGGAGNDTLTGGLGADTYQYNAGGGADTIDNVAADSLIDRLRLLDLTSGEIAFSKSGNNLVMTRTATPTDVLTVTNWFAATANRLDFVNFTNRELTSAQIDALFAGGGTGGVINAIAPRQATTEPVGSVASRLFAEPLNFDAMDSATLASDAMTYAAKADSSNHAIVWQPIKAFSIEGDSSVSTLGAKSAAEDSIYRIWQPIKSYPLDDTDIGVNRLIDAMSTFGADLVGDIGSPAGDASDFEKLGVAPAHDLARMSHLRSEWRPSLD